MSDNKMIVHIINEAPGMDIFALEGRLDINTSQSVRDLIISNINQQKVILLDMQKCVYLSSAGLRALLIIAKRCTELKIKYGLMKLQDGVKDVIVMSGFDTIFKLYEGKEEAIIEIP